MIMTKLLIFICLTFVTLVHGQNWLNFYNQFNPNQNVNQNQPVVNNREGIEEPNNEEGEAETPETEYNYPCVGEVVQMAKPGGTITKETNYWDGRIDLTDYSYLRSIKCVIRVDQPAKIQIDPNEGTVSGPKSGKTFRVTFVGSPSEVSEVNFRIIGIQGTLFPNLVSLHLNNRDICKGATTVSKNIFIRTQM